MIQQLNRYRTPADWHPGAPLLAARWLPGSAWPGNFAPITLGDRVCLSQGTYLCTGNHDLRSPGFDLLLGPGAVLAPGAVVERHRAPGRDRAGESSGGCGGAVMPPHHRPTHRTTRSGSRV